MLQRQSHHVKVFQHLQNLPHMMYVDGYWVNHFCVQQAYKDISHPCNSSCSVHTSRYLSLSTQNNQTPCCCGTCRSKRPKCHRRPNLTSEWHGSRKANRWKQLSQPLVTQVAGPPELVRLVEKTGPIRRYTSCRFCFWIHQLSQVGKRLHVPSSVVHRTPTLQCLCIPCRRSATIHLGPL